jgi:hypothetical protein
VSRLDAAIHRLGGRWFTPVSRTHALEVELTALSEAHHRTASALARLDRQEGELIELRRRVSDLESLLAAQTEQMRRSVGDVLDRLNSRAGEPG